MNKLREGDIIKTQTGRVLEVLKISETSALVRPIKKEKYTIKTRFGKSVEFEKYQNAYIISPNSEVKIIRRIK